MKILGMILVLSIFLTGCSEPVSMDGKLGGSLSSFEETYGENQKAEDDLLYDYISDEGVAAVFMEDQASVITIDLTSEGQEMLSIGDASEYALSFAPSDADEVERTQDPESLGQVIVFESKSLGKVQRNERFSMQLLSENGEVVTFIHLRTEPDEE